jgi:hypothetical protein
MTRPIALNPRSRADALAAMASRQHDEPLDVLVVGGGVVGAGAALDAVTRGLRVGLVEQRDLASGTSSRSSKLVHGGLRYLEMLDFALVKEALEERGLLLTRLAPHLVRPVPFLYPLEKAWERPYVGAGVALYDGLAMAGRYDAGVPRHKHLGEDLIQKRLMTFHTHLYAAPEYLATAPPLETPDDLDHHRLIVYGETNPPVISLNWILVAGREEDNGHPPRRAALLVNNVYGMLRAAERGFGVSSLPDYLGSTSRRLVRALPELEGPNFDAYFVYPEELRPSKRVRVFRDFLLRKVAEQPVW